ncbi:hypothetical protein MMC10_007550 [Thelotrema lepadinum]|nr:hypothetical protein [Thelotrema lepadinum]
MSKKIFAVFGATGNQGGSVANFVLEDEELSKSYSVRIVVRNTAKPAARELAAKGAEVLEADLDDEPRVREALQGVHTVFVLTNFFDHLSKAREIEQSKKIADIAVAQGVEFLIYSSLPSAAKISDGVYNDVQHFDGKADSEEYIRGRPIKSAFYWPGCYMQNFFSDFRPYPAGDGSFAITNLMKPDTLVPLLDITDTGKYVGAMLADPSKFSGRDIAAAPSCYSFEEVAQEIGKATGRKVVYRQIPDDQFKAMLPEGLQEELGGMFALFRDFGLFGTDQKTKVSEDAKEARQKPTSLQEYVTKHAKEFTDLLS